jgi:hypothetical protein
MTDNLYSTRLFKTKAVNVPLQTKFEYNRSTGNIEFHLNGYPLAFRNGDVKWGGKVIMSEENACIDFGLLAKLLGDLIAIGEKFTETDYNNLSEKIKSRRKK